MAVTPTIEHCIHGRAAAQILNPPMEPIDHYLRQCVCCLNVFPTRDASNAFCPECQGAPKIVLPYIRGV